MEELFAGVVGAIEPGEGGGVVAVQIVQRGGLRNWTHFGLCLREYAVRWTAGRCAGSLLTSLQTPSVLLSFRFEGSAWRFEADYF